MRLKGYGSLHDVLPFAYPDPLAPNYNHVAIKGEQTVWLPDSMDINEWRSNPDLPKLPICFDHVITETFARAETSENDTFGIELSSWKAYYNGALDYALTRKSKVART